MMLTIIVTNNNYNVRDNTYDNYYVIDKILSYCDNDNCNVNDNTYDYNIVCNVNNYIYIINNLMLQWW